MKENKYYTPELEEFHIGFEYEFRIEDEWRSLKWNQSQVVQGRVLEGLVRVKYLDKKDLNELGYYDTSKNYFMKDAPGNLGYWTEVLIDYRWWTPEKNELSIKGVRGNEQGILFHGKIKNKSELVQILEKINT